MTTPAPTPRQRKTRIAIGYAGGLALAVVALIIGVAITVLTKSMWGVGIAVLAATGIMALAMVVGWAWMRTLDEAAREAHKAAWYWGGSAGMSVAGIAIILATMPWAADYDPAPFFDGRTDPAAWMATGALASMILMLVGYGVVWAWWWLWRGR